MTDIREELELATDFARANMPARIRSLITLARMDLNNGPLWVDETGLAEGCMGEDGHTRFSFTDACSEIATWAEGIPDIQVNVDFDEETDDFIYETVPDTGSQITKSILGSLHPYIH